jgi:hypothetical protein
MITQFSLSSAPHTSAISPQPRILETPDQIEADVALIVATLGNGYRDFFHASEFYNTEFFKDETKEVTLALAQALVNNFPSWPNLFWNKLLTQV